MVTPLHKAEHPLIVLVGATASGKTALAMRLAQEFGGEIVSCDSVAVYREMEIGTAKPSVEQRAAIPHHMLDVVSPDQLFTAGDYSREARPAIADITRRGRLPIVAGGTGLYLRALLDGLFPSPPTDPKLRSRLRDRAAEKGQGYLHRLLEQLDPPTARLVHANDVPKVIRAIEVSLSARQPMSELWQKGREPLTGYRVLRLGLDPPRALLYERINDRAARMFERGLVEETRSLAERFGYDARPLSSLGYAQAVAVLQGRLTVAAAISAAQQSHRNYAKRQGTWFRKEPGIHWLAGCGEEIAVWTEARKRVVKHLEAPAANSSRTRPLQS